MKEITSPVLNSLSWRANVTAEQAEGIKAPLATIDQGRGRRARRGAERELKGRKN